MKPLTGKHETLLKRENMKPEQVNSELDLMLDSAPLAVLSLRAVGSVMASADIAEAGCVVFVL